MGVGLVNICMITTSSNERPNWIASAHTHEYTVEKHHRTTAVRICCVLRIVFGINNAHGLFPYLPSHSLNSATTLAVRKRYELINNELHSQRLLPALQQL